MVLGQVVGDDAEGDEAGSAGAGGKSKEPEPPGELSPGMLMGGSAR